MACSLSGHSKLLRAGRGISPTAVEMTETAQDQASHNGTQCDFQQYSGVGVDHLPRPVRSLAGPDSDAQVVAWTSNLGYKRFLNCYIIGSVVLCPIPFSLGGLVLLCAHVLVLILVVVAGPNASAYWILSTSDLTIIAKRGGRLCILSCQKPQYNITKIPLATISKCHAVQFCFASALCVKTSKHAPSPVQGLQLDGDALPDLRVDQPIQAPNLGRGSEIVGHLLHEPQWFATKCYSRCAISKALVQVR
jgi:hypothetical protein